MPSENSTASKSAVTSAGDKNTAKGFSQVLTLASFGANESITAVDTGMELDDLTDFLCGHKAEATGRKASEIYDAGYNLLCLSREVPGLTSVATSTVSTHCRL